MSMPLVNSATAGLDDILDELRLKYDSLIGLLDGDAVREVPSLNTLLNLNKLLTKLAKTLDVNEKNDNDILEEIDLLLAKRSGDAADPISQENETESVPTKDTSSSVKKRGDSSLDDGESIPLAKRAKKTTETEEPLEEDDELANEYAEASELVEAKGQNSPSKEAAQNKDLGSDNLVKKEIDDVNENNVNEANEIVDQAPNGSEVKLENGVDGHESLNSKDDPVPPEQAGSFTPDHDSRLKNPHSEFVPSQSLSATAIAELGLWSEENNGLETQGKEYLKKKYGVASYPENDLKLFLPGEIPDLDFSKVKVPQNQVQFSTYQTYIESYFRSFNNEDIAFVNEEFVIPPGYDKNYDPLVTPYLIPKLGDFYVDVWGEEDTALGSKLSSPAITKPPIESYRPKGDFDGITDEKLLTEDISCGPLSNRLLSAILSVHECKPTENDAADDSNPDNIKADDTGLGVDGFLNDPASKLDAGETYKTLAENNDFYSMEERLKRELKYIGIFMNLPSTSGEKPKKGNVVDSEDWILNREDDEICLEIRSLQEELKGALVRNRRRKKALLPIIKEHLAYQEYCAIAEDLDKQVDQAYIKRLKAKSKKKKAATEPTTATPQQQAANSGLKSLLDKRTRWITNIGKVFKAPEVMKRIPSKSVFTDDAQSDDEDADGEVVVPGEEPT